MKRAVSLASAAALASMICAEISFAQAIERVRKDDGTRECAAIATENKELDTVIAAGDPNSNAVSRGAAGAAAGVGGQVAGSLLGSVFGGLGSIVAGQAGNVAARQATESKMAPDAAAKQRAGEAVARRDFLAKLGTAKGCKADDPSFAGNTLTPEEFEKIAAAPPTGGIMKTTPLTLANVTPVLAEPITIEPAAGIFDGALDLKGKQLYISEFRVLFDVGGEVTARTRAGYLPGRDYGATRAKVTYTVPNLDIAALQAITDKAYADLLARLNTAGVKLEDRETFVREHGAVYETTEEPSRPGTPVVLEKNGRKYLVMAPAGMKTHSRGFVGMGTGDMGKRMDWVRANREGLAITVAVNFAALESSGSGSSIFRRESTADAKESMTIASGPDAVSVQTLANVQMLRMKAALPVPGRFANFREVGGYDSNKDVVARTAGIISNLGGLGANQSKRVDLEVDLDGPATARMALRGLATFNQALVQQIASVK